MRSRHRWSLKSFQSIKIVCLEIRFTVTNSHYPTVFFYFLFWSISTGRGMYLVWICIFLITSEVGKYFYVSNSHCIVYLAYFSVVVFWFLMQINPLLYYLQIFSLSLSCLFIYSSLWKLLNCTLYNCTLYYTDFSSWLYYKVLCLRS